VDWSHGVLGGVVIVLVAALHLRRRRGRDFHLRIDWRSDDETNREENP
jgi:hypothetical protein